MGSEKGTPSSMMSAPPRTPTSSIVTISSRTVMARWKEAVPEDGDADLDLVVGNNQRQNRLLLNDGTPASRKSRLRAELAKRFRILLIVGDNLDDFVEGSRADPAARRALAAQHGARWGREWIILPNPIYGHWEASIYGFDRSLSRGERVDRKLQYLSD